MGHFGRLDKINPVVTPVSLQRKEFQKSLKTNKKVDAEAGIHAIERAIHGLATELFQIPAGTD